MTTVRSLKLAQDWRAFEQPVMSHCTPDYGGRSHGGQGCDVADIPRRGCMSWYARVAGRTDGRLSVDRGRDERAGFRSHGSASRGRATLHFTPPYLASAATFRSTKVVTAAPAIDLFAFQYPLSRADRRNLTCLLGAVSCVAGKGQSQPANEQTPATYGSMRRNATQSERGAGQVASRDARHAHFGRIEARRPRWCRAGFADGAGTRTQGNRRVYLLDRVGGGQRRPDPPA